ncbi:hypothetical protein ABZ863_01730 [Saccharomonospora sp. NPDC046836]|uniref:hypothetical protein n=1 Tax=Saccharomonospora sp. NPDC046836 TaxID=3156921 RepID=UPI0033E55C13
MAEQSAEEQVLQELFRHVDELMAEAEGLGLHRPDQGSSLRADDNQADPFHVSHLVVSAIQAGVEHLHAFRTLIADAGKLHPTVPFTLIRGSIETASLAVWLLAPSSRRERVLRRLRYALKDISDEHTATKELGATPAKPKAERDKRVKDVASQAGITAKIKVPTSTEIVEEAGNRLDPELNALAAWRICSGFAHGRTWATLGVLERELIASQEKTMVFRFTNDLDRVLWPALTAGAVVDEAYALYQRQSINHVGASSRT